MRPLLHLLISPRRVFGLGAPLFAWLAALGLVLFTVAVLAQFCRKVWRQARRHRKTAAKLLAIASDYPLAPGQGLPLRGFDAAAEIVCEVPALRRAWTDLRSQCVLRRNADGEDQYWASRSAEAAFTEAAIIDPELDRAFYAAIPGIVTSTGLLFTFLAILVALLDVKIENDQVKGLNLLIEGLSGKFVSSIAALAAATIYLLFEKRLQYSLGRSRHDLTNALDEMIPVLSPAQILVDLTRDISEQSTAFRSFNADLSQKLKQSFSESMGPTLARMVEATEGLTALLRTAEEQKSESITGLIETLITRLESSMTAALSQVSSRFQESLSGGAMAQFQQVIASLGEAGAVLGRMNSQSEATQRMLSEVVALAKDSTAEQFRLGRSQIEELNAVLRGLMAQLNESADSSVGRMNATLTAVVSGLSQHVSDLSEKMSTSIIDSASLATGAANDVIKKADQWSSQSAEQLKQLLETHHAQLDTVKGLRSALEQSLGGFNEALERYSKVSVGLAQVVREVSGATSDLAGTARSARETHEAIERIAGLATKQIEDLAVANIDQREVWRQIHDRMEHYQQVFAKVEGESGVLLKQIAQHLADYVQTSQRGFDGLVKVADDHFANATKRLGGSVNELEELLSTLTEELSRRPSGRVEAKETR